MVVRAGQPLGEATLAVWVALGQVDEVEHDQAAGQRERGLDRVGDALLAAARTVNRSTTTSMLCFSCFFSLGGSVRLLMTPSTRTRL